MPKYAIILGGSALAIGGSEMIFGGNLSPLVLAALGIALILEGMKAR